MELESQHLYASFGVSALGMLARGSDTERVRRWIALLIKTLRVQQNVLNGTYAPPAQLTDTYVLGRHLGELKGIDDADGQASLLQELIEDLERLGQLSRERLEELEGLFAQAERRLAATNVNMV
jgi:hypothetical protein